ncbi:hypothetical protein IF1G_11190 [Cordyceps javanica]|uniref:Secreted protein n=1 Tax=Cordyceps javanica TaxID=43265 RepID=A0A545UL05_9HYPO|nr:hypothetical protein IF1G_11190 [Cordyceps javanica]
MATAFRGLTTLLSVVPWARAGGGCYFGGLHSLLRFVRVCQVCTFYGALRAATSACLSTNFPITVFEWDIRRWPGSFLQYGKVVGSLIDHNWISPLPVPGNFFNNLRELPVLFSDSQDMAQEPTRELDGAKTGPCSIIN